MKYLQYNDDHEEEKIVEGSLKKFRSLTLGFTQFNPLIFSHDIVKAVLKEDQNKR